jgi:hypothetical protein
MHGIISGEPRHLTSELGFGANIHAAGDLPKIALSTVSNYGRDWSDSEKERITQPSSASSPVI